MKKGILLLVMLMPLYVWASEEGNVVYGKQAKGFSAPKFNKKKLLSITQSRGSSTRTGVLEYDGEGRVSKYSMTRDGGTTEYIYSYGNNSIDISCARSRGADQFSYSLADGKIVSAHYVLSGDNMTEDFTYEYDGDRHLTKVTEVLNPKGNVTTYEYLWAGDNRQSLTLNKNGALRATEEYTYSEMTSEPLVHALFGFGLYGAGTVYIDEEYATMALYPYMGSLPANLYSSVLSTDIYSGRKEESSYAYSYETNSSGDIVKVTIDETTYLLEWEDLPSEPEGSKELTETDNGGADYGQGGTIDDSSDLDGKVIGDVYYSISSGNGGYDSVEGCIVVSQTTDDSDIEGKDIFGEDFRSHFTGIVFKVAAGSGVIELKAQTIGNMVLKVKVGTNTPVEMVLDGKLDIKIPYNVTQPTYIYIYASTFGASVRSNVVAAANALKIYELSWQEATAIESPIADSGKVSNTGIYTLDGRRLPSSPIEKGIYIVNGKKFVVK